MRDPTRRKPAMSPRQVLRRLVEQKAGVVIPGAYDGVSAKLVERAGFPAVYMTGYGTSASRLGLPDLGFAGLAEMADHARNMAAAVEIPLIADADTGYGNALSVRRTVAAYEAAGVAALHIEDQVARVARELGTPLLYNYAPGGRSPLLPFARLRALGFAIILLPVDTLLVAVKAMADFLRDVKTGDDVLAFADRYIPFREFNDLIGVNAQLALAQQYAAE